MLWSAALNNNYCFYYCSFTAAACNDDGDGDGDDGYGDGENCAQSSVIILREDDDEKEMQVNQTTTTKHLLKLYTWILLQLLRHTHARTHSPELPANFSLSPRHTHTHTQTHTRTQSNCVFTSQTLFLFPLSLEILVFVGLPGCCRCRCYCGRQHNWLTHSLALSLSILVPFSLHWSLLPFFTADSTFAANLTLLLCDRGGLSAAMPCYVDATCWWSLSIRQPMHRQWVWVSQCVRVYIYLTE